MGSPTVYDAPAYPVAPTYHVQTPLPANTPTVQQQYYGPNYGGWNAPAGHPNANWNPNNVGPSVGPYGVPVGHHPWGHSGYHGTAW